MKASTILEIVSCFSVVQSGGRKTLRLPLKQKLVASRSLLLNFLIELVRLRLVEMLLFLDIETHYTYFSFL